MFRTCLHFELSTFRCLPFDRLLYDCLRFVPNPVYAYPEELDYTDLAQAPRNSARVDAFRREGEDIVVEPFQLPENFPVGPGEKLIYLTLGSMGSIDVTLMKRLVSIVARSPHKYIVSKGPLADEYELPENCWGEGFLPQTRILPIVDLVITHGGNGHFNSDGPSGA